MVASTPPAQVPASELIILVGLTGAGKSTVLSALRSTLGERVEVLPDRRALTDSVLIPEAQGLAGLPPGPVHDRLERFRLTARYREAHPGGMAEVLAELVAARVAHSHGQRAASVAGKRTAPGVATPRTTHLLFDNLRGESEVAFARDAIPEARFVALDCPPDQRIARLAARGDAFDTTASSVGPSSERVGTRPERSGTNPQRKGAGPERVAAALRTVPELERLASIPPLASALRDLPTERVLTAARVVAEESLHYDPEATMRALASLSPRRLLRIDTGRLSADAVTSAVAAWL